MLRIAFLLVLSAALGIAQAEDEADPDELYEDPRPPKPAFVVPAAPAQLLGGLQVAMDDPQIVDQMLRIDPRTWRTLPPAGSIVLADALVRRGEVLKAKRLYRQVLAQTTDEDVAWQMGARSGLGWIAVSQGDLDGVRRYFPDDAGDERAGAPLARVLVALVDAADGRAGAPDRLAALSRDPDVGPQLRDVAALGVVYAHLWARDAGRARRAFEDVRDGRFADDAAYGAAWSRHVAGDDARATAALRELSGQTPTAPRRRLSAQLVRLEPAAVLRAGLQRYRQLHVGTEEAWLAEMLDGDGAQLARAALRIISRPASAVSSEPDRGARAGERAAPGRQASAVAHQDTRPSAENDSSWVLAMAAGVVLAVAASALW